MIICLGIYGCQGKEKRSQTSIPQKGTLQTAEKKTVAFMEGMPDTFHPESSVESARKTRLASFGLRTSPLPVPAPTEEVVREAINKPDFIKIAVREFKVKPVELPAYPFDYENDIEALKRLNRDHHLDAIIHDDMSELDSMKALMLYTNRFMEGGTVPSSEQDLGPSAEVITKLRRERGIGGTSKHYAALLCQLSLSCGFNARMIGMHTLDERGEPVTHDVCEVYLNTYDKWVVFDAFERATYYTRDNVPQSALELHTIMLNDNYRVIEAFSGLGDFSDIISVREKLLPCYRYLYMWRMNDILGKSPRGGTIPWQALYRYHLVWEDAVTTITGGGYDKVARFRDTSVKAYPLEGVRYVTHFSDEFNWPLNHVTFNVERVSEKDVVVHLQTLTPNFKNFKIENGGIQQVTTHRHTIKNIFSQFRVESVNMFGRKGPVSTMLFAL